MRSFASHFGDTHTIECSTFSDGTPNIKIHDVDKIMHCIGGADIVYFSQYSTMEEKKMEEMIIFVFADTRNVRSFTVIDMYDPLATMERVIEEGAIATSNVDAHFWKTLPQLHSGRKIVRVLYDHHTLQNRFYFTNGTTHVSLGSAIPTLLEHLKKKDTIHTVAFPDEGAYKRFNALFVENGFDTIVCGKKRVGDNRIVTINDGSAEGKKVIIVDDLVRSGGTLIQCMKTIKKAGATRVSIFVTHVQFPQQSWKNFMNLGEELDTFYITDTIPRVSDEISGKKPFQLLSLQTDVELQIKLNTGLQ
jgi:phosphoribosylpyrophosphate synthetase